MLLPSKHSVANRRWADAGHRVVIIFSDVVAISIIIGVNMAASAVVFVDTSGVLYSLNDLYTRELLGADLLACAFGWMKLVAAVFMFSLGFFPGKDGFVQIKNLQCNVREKNQIGLVHIIFFQIHLPIIVKRIHESC